ncbi:hypothetical protein PR202_ga04779 [Eleusine coracana subsp. coracana]|uniref:Uncharacterized protein n=1 Tax=Eleusine coracana subsp. coracana TaxID=191504 RepID=A0AAV5BR76_ELECO|nr:hypothetical protein PR202_ga04779 [Eleusine coracana subsp. coracana]
MNANVVRYTAPVCYYFKDGGFAGAAVLSFVATALGLASFMLLRDGTTTKRANWNRQTGTQALPLTKYQYRLRVVLSQDASSHAPLPRRASISGAQMRRKAAVALVELLCGHSAAAASLPRRSAPLVSSSSSHSLVNLDDNQLFGVLHHAR